MHFTETENFEVCLKISKSKLDDRLENCKQNHGVTTLHCKMEILRAHQILWNFGLYSVEKHSRILLNGATWCLGDGGNSLSLRPSWVR